ncbi:MAG: shikimate kinase [Acidobacteriales bacterium]|nr:shikimate kinase [Terriglobales bacterium]
MAKAQPSTGDTRLVCLIGFMGAGKTSVGRIVARRLVWDFVDLDEAIEEYERQSITEIFSRSGQSAFRQSETAALQRVLEAAHKRSMILSIGGGAFSKPENREMLTARRAFIILLKAGLETLWQRAQMDRSRERPLLRDRQSFELLYRNRLPDFEKAHAQVNTEDRTLEIVANEIETLVHTNLA